ncbi:MAG: hypothetical protein HC814_01545 [Rhodobacteraceae bacterium]|nr:hypothetical protein [Paracoccaceae bacterium]
MKSLLVQRDPARIDPVALPFVVFRKAGSPLIVQGIGAAGKTLEVTDPADAGFRAKFACARCARKSCQRCCW